MELLDTPRTGKLGPYVFYTDASGERLFCRIRAIPKDPQTPAQSKMRALMRYAAGLWSRKLNDPQREEWIAASLNAPSHPWLGRYSHLSGQQLEVKINLTLACIGKPLVLTPPEPVAFAPNPVTGLEAVQDPEAGLRLLLSVGTVSEDIMVFGQPPCSAGRMKPRRVYYLGLLGPVTNGQADIAALYTARFGAPAPGKKVFIVTCQTKNGWKAQDHVFSAIIPPESLPGKQQTAAALSGVRPSPGAATLNSSAAQRTSDAPEQAVTAAPGDGRTPTPKPEPKATTPVATGTPGADSASAKGASLVSRLVYKGSTPDARGEHKGLERVHPLSIPGTPLVHSLRMAIGRLWGHGVMRVGG